MADKKSKSSEIKYVPAKVGATATTKSGDKVVVVKNKRKTKKRKNKKQVKVKSSIEQLREKIELENLLRQQAVPAQRVQNRNTRNNLNDSFSESRTTNKDGISELSKELKLLREQLKERDKPKSIEVQTEPTGIKLGKESRPLTGQTLKTPKPVSFIADVSSNVLAPLVAGSVFGGLDVAGRVAGAIPRRNPQERQTNRRTPTAQPTTIPLPVPARVPVSPIRVQEPARVPESPIRVRVPEPEPEPVRPIIIRRPSPEPPTRVPLSVTPANIPPALTTSLRQAVRAVEPEPEPVAVSQPVSTAVFERDPALSIRRPKSQAINQSAKLAKEVSGQLVDDVFKSVLDERENRLISRQLVDDVFKSVDERQRVERQNPKDVPRRIPDTPSKTEFESARKQLQADLDKSVEPEVLIEPEVVKSFGLLPAKSGSFIALDSSSTDEEPQDAREEKDLILKQAREQPLPQPEPEPPVDREIKEPISEIQIEEPEPETDEEPVISPSPRDEVLGDLGELTIEELSDTPTKPNKTIGKAESELRNLKDAITGEPVILPEEKIAEIMRARNYIFNLSPKLKQYGIDKRNYGKERIGTMRSTLAVELIENTAELNKSQIERLKVLMDKLIASHRLVKDWENDRRKVTRSRVIADTQRQKRQQQRRGGSDLFSRVDEEPDFEEL